MSDEMLARRLREAAAKVKAGEQARAERAKLIDEAGRRDWTREAIAELAGITHQAVTKRLAKSRQQDPTE
ncbi:hypothetical protein [Streptosporangium vulgare]|uniref:Uncharacterized protein n=1 Tax=Streptosporangium vulgare TaxID=46190 RepID=A0ABV5TPW9_9ACTN